MDMETELRMKLFLGFELPCRTRKEKQRTAIINKMVTSILPFLPPTEKHPFCPHPNHAHLKYMIALYEKWHKLPRRHQTNYSEFVLEQKIVSYLLKLCYYWLIDDFSILEAAIRHYHNSYKSYFEITDGEIDVHGRWDTLFMYGKWVKSLQEETLSPLAYILTYYNYGSFLVKGKTFVNETSLRIEEQATMSYECYLAAKPKELLLLLQHGGRFHSMDYAELEAITCYELLLKTLRYLFLDFASISGLLGDVIPSVMESIYWQRKLLCLRIMMRVMPPIPVFRLVEGSENICLILKLLEAYNPGSFPDIALRLLEPYKLKHLCRLRIRSQDIISTMYLPYLPDGLRYLNLPVSLIDYLNLLED